MTHLVPREPSDVLAAREFAQIFNRSQRYKGRKMELKKIEGFKTEAMKVMVKVTVSLMGQEEQQKEV